MSLQQLEAEISKLAPADLKQLAEWLNDFTASSKKAQSRPKIGEITSAPVVYSDDCFAPLTDEEMTEWGFA